MRLEEMVAGVEGVTVSGVHPGPIRGIAIDSRQVRPGTLFAALRGRHSDGHDFVPAALSAGAGALLVERDRVDKAAVPAGVALVEAAAVRPVLAEAAARFYRHPSRELDLVGVTGTNGKTTVTYLVESILRSAGRRPGVIGTVSYRWGGRSSTASATTPEPSELQRLLREMVDGGVDTAAMEVSSHALAMHRLGGCRFRAGVFTTLGRDHLDYHRTIEEYFGAKARLFIDHAPVCAVLNIDDPWGRRLRERSAGRVVTYGLAAEADVRAAGVSAGADGISFRLLLGGDELSVCSRLIGTHNVMNMLAAAAVCRDLGAGGEEIVRGLEGMALVPGRFERVAAPGGPLVIVDYAHTPEAVENALRQVRALSRGRVIAVLGCGGERDRGKRPLMGAAAARGADVTFVTSDNPRGEDPEEIVREMLEGFAAAGPGAGRSEVVVDRRRAIASAVGAAGPDDVVLIAGKGHEDCQQIGGRTLPFSDRDEAARALREAGR